MALRVRQLLWLAILAALCPLGSTRAAAEPLAALDREREALISALLDAQLRSAAPPDRPLAERLQAATELLGRNQAFAAAVALLQQPPAAEDSSPEASEWQRLTVQALLANDLLTRASRQLQQLPARQKEAQSLWVTLAERLLQRGEANAALAALSGEPPTARGLQARWLDVGGRALLQLQRPAEAAARYRAFFEADPIQLLAWSQVDALQLHTLRYNAAVSLLRAGATAEGLSQLDQLGQLEMNSLQSGDLRALRDRANVSLGEQLLRNGKAGSAREAYQRVRLQGPYSSEALLGLGWASLAPGGSAQPRSAAPANPISADTPDFVLRNLLRRGVIDCTLYNQRVPGNTVPCLQGTVLPEQRLPTSERERSRSSLSAWQLLIEQDPHSLAGREARLALAQVQAQLGAGQQAVVALEQLARELSAEQTGLATEGLRHGTAAAGELLVPAEAVAPLESPLQAVQLPAARWLQLLRDEPLQRALQQTQPLPALALLASDTALQASLTALQQRYQAMASARIETLLQAEIAALQQLQQAALKSALALRDPGEPRSSPPPTRAP